MNDDQYANGEAADVWEYYIGSKDSRTSNYRNWLVNILHEYNCEQVIDVACGTGFVVTYTTHPTHYNIYIYIYIYI